MVILNKISGTVKFVSAKKIRIKTDANELINYYVQKYIRSNQGTSINQRVIIWPGENVSSGQILADGPCTNEGELALGQNILVAYMPWEGYNFEDAIVISERLVFEDIFTSVHIEKYDIEIRHTKTGLEQVTRDLPNVNIRLIKHLDQFGMFKKVRMLKLGIF